MPSIYKCSNGRILVMSDRKSIFQEIEKFGVVPCVALITAWVMGGEIGAWDLIVKRLLESGCKYFVCAGTYAENLHDLVDEIIISQGKEMIVTTYHEDESPEDVANFFVNATDISNKKNGGLVAILDDAVLGDKLIKESLIRM